MKKRSNKSVQPSNFIFSNPFYFGLLLCCLWLGIEGKAQENKGFDEGELPTVKNPVLIDFHAIDTSVEPGQESALQITFKVPKWIWLGAAPGEARTPPGTKIKFKKNEHFSFGKPIYPEPSVEGVPVNAGLSRIYKGEVTVIVPFTVNENAELRQHEITTYLTYTPGFDAGKLNTIVNQAHQTKVKVVASGGSKNPIPSPSMKEVPDDFSIQPEKWDFPKILSPMLSEYPEEKGFTKLMHSIFIDPPNHGKTIRQAIFPFTEYTLQRGNSIGLGVAILNSTPEGVMTGALSGSIYNNEFLGTTGSLILLTCPAAYHNLQVFAEFSGNDYQSLQVNYENFTLGEADRFGLQAKVDVFSDPRYLHYGIGAAAKNENVSVFEQQNIGTTLDFYDLHISKFRIGAGVKFRDVEIGRGLDDIGGKPFDREGDIPLLSDADFNNPEINTDASIWAGRINFIFDQRNQEFNPTKGFYGKFTTEYNNVSDASSSEIADDYTKFYLDFRKYFSGPSQKFIFLIRNEWTFSTEKNIPFYELPSLGGLGNIRAFDINRFRDQHSFFASMEMRYTVAKVTVMGFPMAMVMGAFLDAGQVFNQDQDLDFENQFNWAPGMSIRMVNYPNVGYTVNFSRGKDGFYTSGGISLPF